MMSLEKQHKETPESGLSVLPTQEVLEHMETIPRGEPETFGATPLDYQAAYTQQCQLLEALQVLVDTDVDESIPADIREYMRDTFAMRFWGRASANHEKYLTALHSADDYRDNPAAIEMIDRAKTGHASPAELILVGDMLGTQSVELGCVSHPYGKRIEQVAVMRSVVQESILLLGGEPIDTHEPRFRVRGIVNAPMWQSEETEGFLMTRKRDIGIMPDGTIIRERTSFILRADIEGIIPEESMVAIRQLDPESPTWRSDVVTAGGLDTIASTLLAADEFSLVIPVSSTIYAFNEERREEIKQRRQLEKERVRQESFSWDEYPALRADRDQLIVAQQNGHVRDSKGMLLKPINFPFGEDGIRAFLDARRLGTWRDDTQSEDE